MAVSIDPSKLPRVVEFNDAAMYERKGMVFYAKTKGFHATFLGDSHDISGTGKFSVDIEPSHLAEVPGNFMLFNHSEIPLPDNIPLTPIKIISYLFHNDEIGFFYVRAHLTNMEHAEFGSYLFRGNYYTVNQITEEDAAIMYPHIFEDHHHSERIEK